MTHHTQVWVNLGAFQQNLAYVKSHLAQEVLFCVVVKGDGYGHGIKNAALMAERAGADCLGIVDNWEAQALREIEVSLPLLRMRPATFDEAQEALRYGVEEVVGDWADAAALSALGQTHNLSIPAHIKLDTGMGRMGFDLKKNEAKVRQTLALPGLQIKGLFSHFPVADEAKLEVTHSQLQTFQQAVERLTPYLREPVIKHIANSSATLRLPQSHLQMVRVGLACYGLRPGGVEKIEPLQPVMRWTTRVAQVRAMSPGATIGYGMTCRLPSDALIATLPFGYADGYPTALSNRADVLIQGRRCPVVGRVSMNMITVDVSLLPNIKPGEEVVLIGRQGEDAISLDELAQQAGMINYELACRIGKSNPVRCVER